MSHRRLRLNAKSLRFSVTRVPFRSIATHTSPLVQNLDPSKLPKYEVSKCSEEWSYVERLLPKKIIPTPKKFEGPSPAGWIAPTDEGKTHPYFVPRTKNHMLPVYLKIEQRGMKKITVVRKVQGNIWLMERELKKHLEDLSTKYHKYISSQVNEVSGQIRFRGDQYEGIKLWLLQKGF
ncbi:hypothetical protein QAD02_020030 [Eretmocerus hayati]|uniref:Uncharacterized protein n=1 Tax=Eretmocerus hayati TaxID=131215 RepID=A0ACC2PMF4_9HYME|nr:hypothetical protein QAD02_020030 [Eretmocerus hayati]